LSIVYIRGTLVDTSWQLGLIEVKCRGNADHPEIMNLGTIMEVMRKAGSDAQEWFPKSDGQSPNRTKA
jgi:hypothetical protein